MHTDDRAHNPRRHDAASSLERLIEARLSRRGLLAGLGAGAALFPLRGLALTAPSREPRSFTFEDIGLGVTASDRWPKGYRAQILLRAGDGLFPDAPAYVPGSTDAAAQARQFGTHNDFLAYMPLPLGSSNSRHGLLCVNHEYSDAHLLWPGMGTGGYAYRTARAKVSRAQIAVEQVAQGHSVVEIRRDARGTWAPVIDSPRNRRITAHTPMRISGPAAGHARLVTRADPSGTRVLGTFNNCAGGVTPWGTVLIAEENFHKYFWGDTAALANPGSYARYGVADDPEYAWGRPLAVDEPAAAEAARTRFCVEDEPNECHRFGWMVEYDPYDPQSTPVKRTAIGRLKHEGADVVVARDGRVVLYTGDDERFEYLYRFVSDGVVGDDRAANSRLLDEGTLCVARFDANGTLNWLPLVFGEGPLTPANGFEDQGDVLIETRRAADLLGATPMDRPEEVQADPRTGAVYVMLTNNTLRTEAGVNVANPRARNAAGHVLELLPPGKDGARDHLARQFTWNVFLFGGEDVRRLGERRANLTGDASARNFRCPDNCAFDPQGRLWIATDGSPATFPEGTPPEALATDGLWAIEVDALGNRRARCFYGVPVGAELCGPTFTPDGETLFVSVQHPGADASFEAPSTRWPAQRQRDDADPGGAIATDPDAATHPPRSSVVAITKLRGADAESAFDPRIGN